MPKYYCDYCDAFLTHDSPSVRKTHNSGRKHKENVRMYYQGWMEQQAQKLVDATAKAFTQQRMMNPGSMPMMGPRGMMPPMPMGMRPGMPPGMPGMPPFPYPMMPPMMMGMPGMPPGMPTGVPPMPAGAMPPMMPQSIPMPTMPQLPQQQPKTEH